MPYAKCNQQRNYYRPYLLMQFLANMNVICCRPSVCRLSSVTFVRPTQAVQIFGNISTALDTLATH